MTSVVRPAHVADAGRLASILVDCVDGGASVGFLLPLDERRATAFWRSMLTEAARGERLVLVAEDATRGQVVGTVSVSLAMPENQPHRAEITKMLVRRDARRRGIGEHLMRAAEAEAAARGKTVLVLDTASADAERLYRRLGWHRVGTIPRYALGPGGGYVDTVLYFKELPGSNERHERSGSA